MPRFLRRAVLTAVMPLLALPCLRASYADADADRIFDAFNAAFYQTQTNNRAYYRENTDGGRAWFWGQANMMEMVADAHDRAPTQARRDRLVSLCRGFTDYHGTNWAWNEYNDDIMWACIVFAKTHLATKDNQYLTRATANFDAVWNRAWATQLGGGLFWKGTSGSRNACVNSPAAIVACMLYDITGNQAYLDKARSIIAWMDSTLVRSNGAIDDHIQSNGSVTDWRFTYNQGTYVGACGALYRITGEIAYLQNAIKAIRYTRDNMCNSAGIFPNHGTSGDGGGFNGIGIRWIARVVRDQGLWDEFYPWLKANANAAWNIRRQADDLSWANWRSATPAPPHLLYSFGCYGSVVALQVVPSADPSDIAGLPGPPSSIHEAETAVLQGGVIATNAVSGFRGTGYADYIAGLGETITWTVNAETPGSHWISFRYGNGGASNRPVRLRVNGALVQDLPFAPTGGWTSWHYTPGVAANLASGPNTIQLTPVGSSAPNVDLLYLSAPPKAPPAGATVLFDGTAQSLAANWKRDVNGAPPNWTVSAGAMAVVQSTGGNDISTIDGYRDFKLHLEWLSPPGGLGQEAGPSGVKLQGRYEIQILNTPRGQTPWPNTAGAIQGLGAPAANASLGAGHWQSYDIDFTAARWNGAAKISDARVTVRWNGVLVHDNVALAGPTESSPAEAPGWHPILLQAQATAASGPVRFRNVWVLPKATDILEAEQAVLAGPATASEHAGYRGTGYADYGSAVGETITWNVDAERDGPHWISFRYANGGGGNRPLGLHVNGNPIQQLPFGPTGGWPAWLFTSGVTVPLVAGTNTIRLVSTINNGPNVDYLHVNPPPTPPPAGALVLFDGTQASLAENWVRDADRSAPGWTVAHGTLGVVTTPSGNDISTRLGFRDFRMHIEWLSPPGGSGQDAGRSGIRLQPGYGIEILNTPPEQAPAIGGAAAIQQQKAPDTNASAGAGHWQSYDIDFTAARWSGGVKTAAARVRVHWNGTLVHDDVTLSSPDEAPGFHPLLLQAAPNNASGPVLFRNIWVAGESATVVPTTPAELWNEWLDLAGLTGPDRDPRRDPDGDGLPNLWEYATGGNPAHPDPPGPDGDARAPRMLLLEPEGGRFAEFTFIRRTDHQARGLAFSAETSPTLAAGDWTVRPAIPSGDPVPVGDGTHERVTLRVTLRVELPPAGEPALFVRLRVERGE